MTWAQQYYVATVAGNTGNYQPSFNGGSVSFFPSVTPPTYLAPPPEDEFAWLRRRVKEVTDRVA